MSNNKIKKAHTLLFRFLKVCLNLCLVASLIAASVKPGLCAGITIQTIIYVTMRAQPQLLAYNQPNVAPIIQRAQVAYSTADNTAVTLADYEWFHDGSVLGLERHSALALTPGTNVTITVNHAGPAPNANEFKAECKSIANTLRRLSLDVFIHGARLAAVSLPTQSSSFPYDSFGEISQNLMGQGFIAGKPEEALNVSSGILIPLQSPSNQQLLVYQ